MSNICFVLVILTVATISDAGRIRSRKFPIGIVNCHPGGSRFCTDTEKTDSPIDIPANFSIFGKDYQSQNRPTTKPDEVLEVKISMDIITVHRVSEVDKDVTFEIVLQVEWEDQRLQIPSGMKENQYLQMHPNALDQCLWIPDAFIYHVKDLQTSRLLTSAGSLRINRKKQVIYTSQMMIRLGCHMDFFLYPVDTQECSIRIASYGHTSSQMRFSWSSPVTVEDHVNLDEFRFEVKDLEVEKNTSATSSPTLVVTFVFHRYLSFHLLQTYIPSALFVIVAYLSLFVPRKIVPGRMVLCMTTLVTLTTMLSAVRQIGPRCSYLKAIDIWMVACIIFVFFCLSQYALILRWHSSVEKRQEEKKDCLPSIARLSPSTKHTRPIQPITRSSTLPSFRFQENLMVGGGTQFTWASQKEGSSSQELNPSKRSRGSISSTFSRTGSLPFQLSSYNKLLTSYGELRIDRIEVICIIIYPISFGIFNLIYWSWILSK